MRRLITGLMLGLLSIALAACVQATPVPVTPSKMLITPTKAIQPTPVPSATPAATATPEKKADACIDCHTDKEKLIKNLKPVVEVPKESEGSG